jgi:OPA family glycerol-3-phosphate transporter-like MFS transporter
MPALPGWLTELSPIAALLVVIALVVSRLPKVELGHSKAFLQRRFFNWFPVGMTYAFLYMGRYNVNVCKNALGSSMSKGDFGTIFFWGTLTYGLSFLINGPLADRLGGRKTIMISAIGSAVMILAMGAVLFSGRRTNLVGIFSLLYALNMYFQSFGAVSIVKVNAAWFHVRERGTFGGIFGILISLGIYFAFDWGRLIVENAPIHWVFFTPTIILVVLAAVDYFTVRDTPASAGLADFDTADASSGDDGPPLNVWSVAKLMLRNPVIMTIAAVEFCSGFLRNAIMQWYSIFAKETGIAGSFIPKHWGMLLCIAGILGGMMAGVISDRVFQSRRGPVCTVLYGAMLAGACGIFFLLDSPYLGVLMLLMSMCIIGVHGMLSGTASMDFGGKKNVGVAVGIIDGFVYLGTAAEAVALGRVLPADKLAKLPANWWTWPAVMVPLAVVGCLLVSRLWNAKPKPKAFAAASAA